MRKDDSEISVLLVDDHRLVRFGIRRILDDMEGICVVAEADCGEDALQMARLHAPDVVLMDITMPGIGGLEATRKLLRIAPHLRIIALTIHLDEPFPSRLLEAGAAGYLSKNCTVDEIVQAIHAVSRGKRYLDNEIAQKLAMSGLNTRSGNCFAKLSQREMQVMLMITQGYRLQAISDILCLSPKTVSTYRHRLTEKLGVETDVELTHLALRHGMISQIQ